MAKKKINTVSKIFNFRENDYNLAKNTKFLAKSNFNSSANFDLVMTNDGTMESLDQEEFVFGFLAGFRRTYKNKLLVQDKQTVWGSFLANGTVDANFGSRNIYFNF